MAAFDPKNIKPASKSVEFNKAPGQRSAKATLLAGIDTQVKLFKDPKAEGRRWFQSGKTETAFSLRYGNKALVLVDGEKQVVVPTADFEAALAYFKGEVAADKYADQLAVLEKAGAERTTKMQATRKAKAGARKDTPKVEAPKPDAPKDETPKA